MAPVPVTHSFQKLQFLNVISKYRRVDAPPPGHPDPLKLSKAAISLLASTLVRDLSTEISNPEIALEVRAAGRRMAEVAVGGLIAGWEDGDDWCPPLHWPPKPRPGPWPWLESLKVFEPEPEPWFDAGNRRVKDQLIGIALAGVAPMAPDEQLASQIRDLATKLQS